MPLADLDHPIASALRSAHAHLALVAGTASRYPRDVEPFVHVEATSPAAFTDLATLVEPGETVATVGPEPLALPAPWELVKSMWIDQMVCAAPAPTESALAPGYVFRALAREDVPAMLALTAATRPGPFLENTLAMGCYFGIFTQAGELAAMAGERLELPDLTEVSAVCCDPAHRGKGLARYAMVHVMQLIQREGKTPFLHVKSDNNRAKALYADLGYHLRRAVAFTVFKRRGGPGFRPPV